MSIYFYLKYNSHQLTSYQLGWRRRGGGYKFWPRLWARLGSNQHSEERSRTCPSQRFRCSLHFCNFGQTATLRQECVKLNIFLFCLQVSGRSLCHSQSYTLFGGLGSPWVETSWCWLVEGDTHCLLCTSTEEEPGSCLGPWVVTSSWTSKCPHPRIR